MSIYENIIRDVKEILGLDFRINDLNEATEVKMGDIWHELTDTMQAVIEINAAEIGYGIKGGEKPSVKNFWNACTKLADIQRYNPIKDWLFSLRKIYIPVQEPGQAFPQPHLINCLAKDYFTNPDGFFGPFLFRWMTGAIAKILIQERNPMLVLVADQHIGKSFFARWLCSIGQEYFLEGGINPDNKDCRIRLTDHFLHEVGELGATTRRADSEALKEFITKKFNTDRYPYGKRPLTKPTICSFIGSVNSDGAGFLNDPTGSTRFLACNITQINFTYSTEIKPDLLWAEAMWFYDHSEQPWKLTDKENKAREEINGRYEIVTGLEDVVDEFLEISGKSDDFMATIEIRDLLAVHYKYTNETAFARDLARVLYKMGAEPSRSPFKQGQGHRRGYRCIKKRYPSTRLD
jgi:predicted P-loop ATPase